MEQMKYEQARSAMEEAGRKVSQCVDEVRGVVDHPKDVLRTLMVPIIGSGNGLLMGEIGCGKTTTVKALSGSLGLIHGRVDCTPDLFATETVGGWELSADGKLEFVPAPALQCNVLQVEEINRASPKSQAGMISIMEEREITIRGKTYYCMLPFIVLATQNPQESTGIFPLPEAQLDRFMVRVDIPFPSRAVAERIVLEYPTAEHTANRAREVKPVIQKSELASIRELVNAIQVGDKVAAICDFCDATRPESGRSKTAKAYGLYGGGPRALRDLAQTARALALMDGEFVVGSKQLREAALPALRHRVGLNREGRARFGRSIDDYLRTILEEVRI